MKFKLGKIPGNVFRFRFTGLNVIINNIACHVILPGKIGTDCQFGPPISTEPIDSRKTVNNTKISSFTAKSLASSGAVS